MRNAEKSLNKITFYGQMVWSGTHDQFFNFGIPVPFEWIKVQTLFMDRPFQVLAYTLDDE